MLIIYFKNTFFAKYPYIQTLKYFESVEIDSITSFTVFWGVGGAKELTLIGGNSCTTSGVV